MSYQGQITEQQQRLEQAYTAYRAVYTTMTPPPELLSVPQLTEYKADNKYIRGVLGVILIGSMIVSGSHTIPTFAGADATTGAVEGLHGFVGVAAFFMLEAAIVAFAYIRTQRHIQVTQKEPANFQQLVTRGLGIAFSVAVLGNIDYTLRSKGFYIAEIFQVFILLGMAISAPVLAFITGDILAVYQVQDRVKQRKHIETYEQRVREVEEQNRVITREWNDGLARAWEANKARWGGTTNVRVERPSAHSLPVQPVQPVHSLNSVNSANGYTKQMDSRSIIQQFFANHPEHFNGKLDELVVMIKDETGVKVGRTSIHNVRKEMTQYR